jgi:flagellar biosynthesis/type III secretory pathway chaperone
MNETISGFRWEVLIDALRQEFQEYGGVLSLMDDQQQAILHRRIEELEVKNQLIFEQIELAGRYRQDREAIVSELEYSLNLDGGQLLSSLVHQMPQSLRPLMEALIQGANDLIAKIQKRARQNRLLLARSSEVTEKMLNSLQPMSFTKTYTHQGGLRYRQTSRGRSVNISA